MFTHVNAFMRRVRRRLNTSEWLVRQLRLSTAFPEKHEPGLVLLQIDGLSKSRFDEFLARGVMPFTKRLGGRERYRLWKHYSGIPSSTPAVQGEMLYGVKQCVPAFKYRDCQSGEIFLFQQPVSAAHMQERLELQGEGLLKGGSSYANIFSGGARESHFCLGTLDRQSYWKTFYPYSWLLIAVLNPLSLLRALTTAAFDLAASLYDWARGLLDRKEFAEEAGFIPVRTFVTVFLRQFITMGCQIDIARGFPVIHVNFFGYDEVAHRYGPSSLLARLALRDIDRSIQAIWKQAATSLVRDYDVWLFSDHGQEETVPYRIDAGVGIEEAVQSVLIKCVPEKAGAAPKPIVTARGPLGFIYPKYQLTPAEKERTAEALVQLAGVPMVLTIDAADGVKAWTAQGCFHLPEEAARVFGEDHPYLHDAAREFADLALGHDCGPFILSGWKRNGKCISFPVERGSHGGPGPLETGGFAFLPSDAPLRQEVQQRPYLRPTDLREASFHFLEGEKREALYAAFASKGREEPLRIMTYNVHSCIGMDRKLAPERVARIIARHAPDIVCLQELDNARFRTGGSHQAEVIAKMLNMTYHFFPVLRVEEEQYGDAILSRYPLRLIRAGQLAGLSNIPDLEPRGALWVEIDFFGQKIQVINTHLGLLPKERDLEIDDLLGPEWLGSSECISPVIFCGDLNTSPQSSASKRLRARFQDTQMLQEGAKALKTWPCFAPWMRLDYIYVSAGIPVARVDVPDMALERVTSDHFPLVADLKIL